MKAVLVFSPFSLDLPTYIPMGIASLKAHIESKSRHKVKCLDFNLEFFLRAFFDDKWDICSYCRENHAACGNFKMVQSVRNYRSLVRELLVRLKEDREDYRTKCAVRQRISDFYAPFTSCFRMAPVGPLRESEYKKLKRVLSPLADEITAEGPDIIGFSVFVDSQLLFSLALAKLLKEICGKDVVFGGGSTACMAKEEKYLFLKRHNFVDYLVEKEGEEAMLSLLNGESPDRTPNLIYRKNNCIEASDIELGVSDINHLPPPDYTDFKINEYVLPKPVLPLSTSRNCPWNKCIFCNAALNFNKGFRQKDVSIVMSNLKILIGRHKTSTFFFMDTYITAEYARGMAAEIKKAGIDINYAILMRCEKGLEDSELVGQFYRSGCKYIDFGIETMTPRLLKLIDKGTETSDIREILLNCKRNNIYCHSNVIFGLPTQTVRDIKRDTAELKEICDETDFTCEANPLRIFPGTALYNRLGRYKNMTTGRGCTFEDPSKLNGLTDRANDEFNNDRTFGRVYNDAMFLAAVNSYKNKL